MSKIEEYFQILQKAMLEEDFEQLELYLRLSRHYREFTREGVDLFEEAEYVLALYQEERLAEPDEAQEWHDFDPDC